MDEQRKHAYRYLLYWAMLDIRPLGWLCWGWFRAWNPFCWMREGRRIRCSGAIADWLHNLALFSSLNFERFNEEWFWRDFESLKSRYPECGLERYRNLFEQRLSEPLHSEVAEQSVADVTTNVSPHLRAALHQVPLRGAAHQPHNLQQKKQPPT